MPETAKAPFSSATPKRVAFFIDGFNLYHAVHDLGDNRLKWLNLHSLAMSYVRPGEQLTSVVYFTALNTWDKAKRKRHLEYLRALQNLGVEVALGGFLKTPKWCRKKDRTCHFHFEKKTDVGIAVRLIADAFENKFDKAFLITADSDQVPLIERFKSSHKDKQILLIAPPKRLTEARELSAIFGTRAVFHLTAGRIRQNLLDQSIYKKGKLLAARPTIYGIP
jgi:uncharacterized LabA/DUF88 family protein